MQRFSFYHQLYEMDCGPTCLKMIAKYYGRYYKTEKLRQLTGFSKLGVSLYEICIAAEKIGFKAEGVKLSFAELKKQHFPCILHWNRNHFVVLISIKRKVKIADPSNGICTLTIDEFLLHWSFNENQAEGFALLLSPTNKFYEFPEDKENKMNWKNTLKHLSESKGKIAIVLLTLFATNVLLLIFPFLTKSIVDDGIKVKNLNFILLILIAQLTLTLSQTALNFIRNLLLLKISNFFNLNVLSSFWEKLTNLPLSYFESRQTGDTLQRINDHHKIQGFLTGTALNTLFSFFSIFIYSIILFKYNRNLPFIFFAGSIIYFLWIKFFLDIQRKFNHEEFNLSTKVNDVTLQFIHGMQEIKLNNAEFQKKEEWKYIQTSMLSLQLKKLKYDQWQQAGALLINQSKNILISFYVATLVVHDQLTFGTMLAIQYILGQLDGPLEQWINFIQAAQKAKISMERLNEIHNLKNEEDTDIEYINVLPKSKNITIRNLTFSYPSADKASVLKQISTVIPAGKVTAIVGTSGSGKTTLLKILLKIYEKYEGEIFVGTKYNDVDNSGCSLGLIRHGHWRKSCGVVLQDGFIFNDTIAKNIAVNEDCINQKSLINSCKIANIYTFINSLPNTFNTKIGENGIKLSHGQRQRLLIARAIYKNPEYLFFDEATNSLDTINERIIIENLHQFFKGRTVLIIAHRLSTVKKADKIIVLQDGEIIEEGNHNELILKKKKYYALVKNQLEFDIL